MPRQIYPRFCPDSVFLSVVWWQDKAGMLIKGWNEPNFWNSTDYPESTGGKHNLGLNSELLNYIRQTHGHVIWNPDFLNWTLLFSLLLFVGLLSFWTEKYEGKLLGPVGALNRQTLKRWSLEQAVPRTGRASNRGSPEQAEPQTVGGSNRWSLEQAEPWTDTALNRWSPEQTEPWTGGVLNRWSLEQAEQWTDVDSNRRSPKQSEAQTDYAMTTLMKAAVDAETCPVLFFCLNKRKLKS